MMQVVDAAAARFPEAADHRARGTGVTEAACPVSVWEKTAAGGIFAAARTFSSEACGRSRGARVLLSGATLAERGLREGAAARAVF